MVNLTTFMVMATAMLLGVNALDKPTADKIKEELVRAKIIPEVLEEFEPLTRLKITYDEHNDLENGELLKPEETLVAPSIWFDPPNKNVEYTLAMVNLDSNGPLVRHWIATNAKGGDEKGTAFLSQLPNRQYTSYKGPTPPSGSKNHRVAFILYEQQAVNQTFVPEIDGSTTRDRAFFNLTQFAQENNLKPISGAYFYTEYQEGFSQQYPPADDDISEEIHKAGLVDDILDDVGNILDLDSILGINIGVGNKDDDDYDDDNDAEIKKPKPSPSVDPDTKAKSTPKPKKNGLLHGILDGVHDLLDDILGNDDDDDDDDDDKRPTKKKPSNGNNNDDDNTGINIDLNLLRDVSASASVSASAAKPSTDLKQAGLLGNLLDNLDDILNLHLNVGHDRDDDDSNRPPQRRPSNGGDDDDDDDGIIIDLNVLRLVSASASASAAKPSTDLKQAGLLDGLLDDLGNILDIDINIGHDDDNNNDNDNTPPRRRPNNGHDDNDDDRNDNDLVLMRDASASVSASAAKPSTDLKQAGLLDGLLGDLGGLLGIDTKVGNGNSGDNDHDHGININILGNNAGNSNKDKVIVKVESNRAYPPLLAEHISPSASAAATAKPSASIVAAELRQAGILDNLIDSIGYLLGNHLEEEEDIVTGDLVIENDAASVRVIMDSPSSAAAAKVVELAALKSLVADARSVSIASAGYEEEHSSAASASS
ncbi:hypothetical protein PS15m_009197 [Mucor circinelloides]